MDQLTPTEAQAFERDLLEKKKSNQGLLTEENKQFVQPDIDKLGGGPFEVRKYLEGDGEWVANQKRLVELHKWKQELHKEFQRDPTASQILFEEQIREIDKNILKIQTVMKKKSDKIQDALLREREKTLRRDSSSMVKLEGNFNPKLTAQKNQNQLVKIPQYSRDSRSQGQNLEPKRLPDSQFNLKERIALQNSDKDQNIDKSEANFFLGTKETPVSSEFAKKRQEMNVFIKETLAKSNNIPCKRIDREAKEIRPFFGSTIYKISSSEPNSKQAIDQTELYSWERKNPPKTIIPSKIGPDARNFFSNSQPNNENDPRSYLKRTSISPRASRMSYLGDSSNNPSNQQSSENSQPRRKVPKPQRLSRGLEKKDGQNLDRKRPPSPTQGVKHLSDLWCFKKKPEEVQNERLQGIIRDKTMMKSSFTRTTDMWILSSTRLKQVFPVYQDDQLNFPKEYSSQLINMEEDNDCDSTDSKIELGKKACLGILLEGVRAYKNPY